MPGAFETIVSLIDGAQPFGPWMPPEALPCARDNDRRLESGRQVGTNDPQSDVREGELVGDACDEGMVAERPPSCGPNNDDAPGVDMFGPRAFGFDMEALNRKFALVLMGSKAVVFLEPCLSG